MKKLITLCTLLLCAVVNSWGDETVNVTWFPASMTSGTFSTAGTADVENLMTVSDATHSSPVSDPVFRSKNGANWAKFTSSNVNVNGGNANRWLATDYIIFSVTIADGVTFTPTGVTATAAGSGSNGCNADLFASIQASAQSGQGSGIAKEENGGKALSLTTFSSTTYNGGETLTFYMHIGIPSGKAISIHNVVLTGTYKQSAKTKWSKPSFTLGDYDGSQYAVTIDSEDETTIKYTIGEGDEQTSLSNSQNVNAAPGTIIKAVATGTGFDDSSEASFTVPAAPKVTVPTAKIKSYDFAEGGYAVTITSATEGSTIYYKVGDDNYEEVANGATVYLKNGSLKVKASKSGYSDSDEATIATLNAAPSIISPETLIQFQTTTDSYDKDADHIYKSVTIPGTYIAGIYSGQTGLKLRCSKNLTLGGSSVKAFHLNVADGYTVTAVKFTNLKANRNGTIEVPAMYVDGAEVGSFEPFTIPANGGSAITKEFTGLNAASQIAWQLTPGKYDSTKDVDQFLATIEVTYETTVSGTITASGFSTYSTKHAVDLSTITGGTAYIATGAADGKVTLEKCEAKVPAATGLLIAGTADDTFTINTTADATEAPAANLLVGMPAGGEVPVDKYVFAWPTSDPSAASFYIVETTPATLGAGKAYLDTAAGGARLSLSFGEDAGEATGISEMKSQKADGAIFNLRGQRVAQPQKGLYIMNGKKTIVK